MPTPTLSRRSALVVLVETCEQWRTGKIAGPHALATLDDLARAVRKRGLTDARRFVTERNVRVLGAADEPREDD